MTKVGADVVGDYPPRKGVVTKVRADVIGVYPKSKKKKKTPSPPPENSSTKYEGHTLAEKTKFIKTFLSEGIQKTLRQSVQAVKASTEEVPGYAPGGNMGKNPHATKLKLQIKSGRERAAKRKRPATGTDIAVSKALKKLKNKPRIEDYMSKKERENLLRLQLPVEEGKKKPFYSLPPSSEAIARLKQLRADRKEKQVESKQVTPPTPKKLKVMHKKYVELSTAAGRTPGKPHPMHGEHFPEDPPKENLTPAQQKRRNKTK